MKKINKFLSIFLCLALIVSIIPMGYISASAETRFSGGDGESEATAFEISTEADLIGLATAVNGGENFYGKFFKQTVDITVENFVPIGCWDIKFYSFKGTYNGDNYEINGSIGAKEKDCQALFGYVGENGTIKNVINNATVNGNANVGGIVGQNSEGTIINCYNTGNVTGNGNYIGGVVGNNYGSIKDCYNTGIIKGNADYVGGVVGKSFDVNAKITNCYNTGDIKGNDNVGGVAGKNSNSIETCYNTGVITGNKYVGGIVGENNNNGGEITSCYNTGSVIGASQYMGVIGRNYNGTITNCYYDSDKCSATDTNATGKTTAEMTTQDFVDLLNGETGTAFEYCEGNFAYNCYPYVDVFGASSAQIASAKEQEYFTGDGLNEETAFEISSEADLKKLAEIVNAGDDCTNLYFTQTADITVTDFVPIGKYDNGYLYFNGTYDGGNNEINGTIGDKTKDKQALFGLVGKNGTIKNIINNANVKGYNNVGGIVSNNYGKIENCQNNGNITCSNVYIGGVVAINFYDGKITNCYNTGTITGEDNVGGVVGYNNYGKITNCFNTGSVTGATFCVGGIISYSDHGEITNCFNTGAVKGTGDNVGGVLGLNSSGIVTNCYNTGAVEGVKYVGGVFGKNIGTTTNCYYNKDVFISEDTAGKTTLEMSTQEFVDLLNGDGEKAFSYIDGVFTYYYPYLTVFGEDSAVISKEKVEYKITKGDNQEIEIGTDGTLAFTSVGEFDKFKALYLGDEIKKENLVADTNYTAVSGSTKITLNADYVKTLPLGKQTFTLGFVDGYSTVNFEVTKGTPDYTIPTNLTATYGDTLADVTLPNGFSFDDVATTPVGNVGNNIFKITFTPDDEVNYNKVENLEVTIKVKKAEDDKKPIIEDDKKPVIQDDTTDDTDKPADDTENPKTDANSNVIFISIIALISVAGVYEVKKKLVK